MDKSGPGECSPGPLSDEIRLIPDLADRLCGCGSCAGPYLLLQVDTGVFQMIQRDLRHGCIRQAEMAQYKPRIAGGGFNKGVAGRSCIIQYPVRALELPGKLLPSGLIKRQVPFMAGGSDGGVLPM